MNMALECVSNLFAAYDKKIKVLPIGNHITLSSLGLVNGFSYESSDIYQLLGFLWKKAKSKNIILASDRNKKITLMPYNNKGVAEFQLQLETKVNGIGYVKNILDTEWDYHLNFDNNYWISQLKKYIENFNRNGIRA